MSLEKPKKIWWNGHVGSWEDARVHVTAETAMRGVNVFEGVMAYKIDGHREHAVIALRDHLERLARSADLLHLPKPFTTEEMAEGVAELIRQEPTEKDLYIRPTFFLDHGAYTGDPASMAMGAYVTAYTRERSPLREVALVSTPWTRLDDPTFPAQAKSGAVYSAFRLARIAAAQAGGDEPLMLNARGNVAETAGAAIMVVLDDHVVTPPASEGALESITRGILTSLLQDRFDTEVVQCPIRPAELHDAAAVLLCGTLDEVVKVSSFDGVPLGTSRDALIDELFEAYRSLCTGSAETAPAVQTRVAW